MVGFSMQHQRRKNKRRADMNKGRVAVKRSAVEAATGVEFPIFIEDTDCFGVVFYANYFRYFQRSVAAEAARGFFGGSGDKGVEWSLVGIDHARFSSAARLGDTVTVHSNNDHDSSSKKASDDEQAVRQPRLLRCFQSADVSSKRCVTANTTYVDMARGDLAVAESKSHATCATPFIGENSLWVMPYADELTGFPSMEQHGALCRSPSALDALRWFERGRTMAIGGPKGLENVRAGGLLVVVTRLDGFWLAPTAAATPIMSGALGEALEVRTRTAVPGRGHRIVFDQQVWDARARMTVAKGMVTCVCVNEAKHKLVAVPQELLAVLSSPSCPN